jgi:ABC-2 type transport system permease protein
MANTLTTIMASYKLKVKDVFVYRGMMVLWILGWVLSFMSMVYLWRAAEMRGESLAGFDQNQIITYYFIGILVWAFCGWYAFWWVAQAIKDGSIVRYITRPMSFHWHTFAGEFAWHTVNSGIYLIFLVVIYFLTQEWLVINTTFSQLALFILAMVLAALVTFEFNMFMSTAAFWIINFEGLGALYWMVMTLFGGHIVPLSFYPSFWQSAVKLLPFRYMYSFPIEIFLSRISGWPLVRSYLTAAGWIAILYFLYKIFWQKGLKEYTAFGQ